ncbi:MAG TPA: tetratricopeptide repeat protein [bacterium]|jgi:tetratricopeptide (TPR) repeat protein|nr:tetratricopeptide repeat protein [bacterium]
METEFSLNSRWLLPARRSHVVRRALAVATLVAALLIVPGVRGWIARAVPGPATGEYRYPFQRATRGAVIRDLQAEIGFYQDRIRRDPTGGLDPASLAGAYLRMARATGDLSWYLLAEQAARRSLANLPYHNTGAILVLARIAEARHDFPEALRLAAEVAGKEEALAIQVTSYLAMGALDEAAGAADQLLPLAPTLGAYTLRGLVQEARGRDEEALADFHRALALEEPGEAGGSAAVRAYLGRLHYRRGRLDQARTLYREALRILPQHPLTLINLAELELRQGRYADAERHLAEVVTITEASPNVFDHAVLRGLARAKALAGDASGAEALWDEAERRLRRDVTDGTFGHRRELARLLLERGRSPDAKEALALMRNEVKIRRDAETLDILAWALTRAGRWGEARAAMREALARGIRDAGMLYRAGLIEQALGHTEATARFFSAVLSADPGYDQNARRVAGLGLWEGER